MAGRAAGADCVPSACGADGAGSCDTDGSELAAGALMVGSDIELLDDADDSAGGAARPAGCDCCAGCEADAAGEPMVGMGEVVVVVLPGRVAGLGSTRLLS